MNDVEQLLQYGWLGVIVAVFVYVGLPLLREHVLPAQREMRDREVRAIETLAATMQRFGEVLSTMDQRLAAVERDQEAMREDMTVVVERLPNRSRSTKAPGGAA